MPGPNRRPARQRRSLPPDAGEISEAAESKSAANSVADIDVERWAPIVADGQAPFPQHITPPTRKALIQRVAQLRRQRLLKFIARVIALDIHLSCDLTQERNEHVKAENL
jgi:hypothetical protein